MTTLRLRHPDLAFHIDVSVTEHEGRWLAVAMTTVGDRFRIEVPDDGSEVRLRRRA